MKYVKDDKREQKRIEKLLQKMSKAPHVAVGILQDEAVADNFSMVDLALVHEFGSKDGRIPQRSFMRATCDAKRNEHIKLADVLQSKIIEGKLNLRQALGQLGEVAEKDMVQAINNGLLPQLKPATIRRKKNGSKPLIDTGRLKGSIKHEIRHAS
jgi:phage gpG-like protein